MINREEFKTFLSNSFSQTQLSIHEFDKVFTFDIDCLKDNREYVVGECTDEFIKIDKILKSNPLDFSLYKYVFSELESVERFILAISESGVFK